MVAGGQGGVARQGREGKGREGASCLTGHVCPPLCVQEIKRIQAVPLVIGQFMEMIDTNYGIVSSTTGSTYHVRILSTLDKEKLKPNTSIALHRHAHSVVEILPPEADSSVQMLQMTERPDVTYEV